MTEILMSAQPHMSSGSARGLDTPFSDELSSVTSGTPRPQPNPTFVFPSRSDSPSRSIASSDASTGPRHISSRSRPSKLTINALPAFEFGTASPSAQTAISSPTRSPIRKTPPPAHGSGHRRGGSEFIGGDAIHGGPVLIGTSPTKSDSSDPAFSNPGPRRGHAHRRSGAASQTDISMIMGRQRDLRDGSESAPTTPSDFTFRRPQMFEFERSMSQPECAVHALESQVTAQQSVKEDGLPRSRVGFSEVLEYIPRPLSTISSDTSSSMSTVRASHSVTDSTNSVFSGNTASPPSLRAPRFNCGALEHLSRRARASTCNSVASSADEDDQFDEAAPMEPPNRPASAPVGELLPTHEGSTFSTSCTSLSTLASSVALPIQSRELQQLFPSQHSKQATRPRTSPEPKVIKRQRKVRSWTGLLRKGKQSPEIEAPTSHPSHVISRSQSLEDGDFCLDNVTFDEDTTYIIESSVSAKLPSPSSLTRPSLGVSPLSAESEHEHEHFSPMIDIDAALGTGTTSDDEAATALSFGTKRRMHSSGETGGFSGPGMHYHRRTESAPEMEVFDRPWFGFPRFGSNPTMTDAIEEEEEDIEHKMKNNDAEAFGLGVNIVENDQQPEPSKRRSRREARIDQAVPQFLPDSEQHEQSEHFQAIDIVGPDEEPRFSVITKSSDESTITPTLSHDPLAQRRGSAPIDFAMQTPSLVYSTPETASALSSAEYSKTSFDAPDIPQGHTASSSITDRTTLNSSRVGDAGLSSVDDVPSLTSSASTMLSGHPTRFSSSSNTTASADRSFSLSATVPSRARADNSSKRSSLASLSRLVGNSYNKSKLNIEESAPPDSPQKFDRKKRHRLSRMMRFWKSKEKLSST